VIAPFPQKAPVMREVKGVPLMQYCCESSLRLIINVKVDLEVVYVPV